MLNLNSKVNEKFIISTPESNAYKINEEKYIHM